MSSDEDLLQSVKIVLIEKCNLEKENERLTKELEELKTCPRCISHHLPKELYPCSDCKKDGVLTKWH